jgi:hypothetical protein
MLMQMNMNTLDLCSESEETQAKESVNFVEPSFDSDDFNSDELDEEEQEEEEEEEQQEEDEEEEEESPRELELTLPYTEDDEDETLEPPVRAQHNLLPKHSQKYGVNRFKTKESDEMTITRLLLTSRNENVKTINYESLKIDKCMKKMDMDTTTRNKIMSLLTEFSLKRVRELDSAACPSKQPVSQKKPKY